MNPQQYPQQPQMIMPNQTANPVAPQQTDVAGIGAAAVAALQEYADRVGAKSLTYDTKTAKVSVVGAGMETHEGVAAKMFEALSEKSINIQMISTSEIKVSVLIAAEEADRAVSAVHAKFFDEM